MIASWFAMLSSRTSQYFRGSWNWCNFFCFGWQFSIISVSTQSFPSISVMLFSVIVVCYSLADVVIFSQFSIVLLSVVHLFSDIFPIGVKSRKETVDSSPSTKHTCVYCRFTSTNCTSSTRSSYLLVLAWHHNSTGPCSANQEGTEWPLGDRHWMKKVSHEGLH